MEKPRSTNRVQAALAAVVVIGFFAVFIALFILASTSTSDSGLREARLMMIGTLQTGFGMVLAYYFGSTSGSAQKTEMLAKSTPTPSEPNTVTTTTTSQSDANLTDDERRKREGENVQ